MLDFDFDDRVLRELRHYVRLVSEALGLRGESSFVHADDAASAYIALDRRLARYPDRDVALLWDDVRGWAVAVETDSGADLPVVAHFGDELMPPPANVAAWVAGLCDGEPVDGVPPPRGTVRFSLTDTGI